MVVFVILLTIVLMILVPIVANPSLFIFRPDLLQCADITLLGVDVVQETTAAFSTVTLVRPIDVLIVKPGFWKVNVPLGIVVKIAMFLLPPVFI
jgi:hypothetical protein